MWKLVLDLSLREADTGHQLVGYVYNGPDFDIDRFAFLEVFVDRALQLLLVAANEQSGDVMRVRELPVALCFEVSDHGFELIQKCLRLSCLLEGPDKQPA